MIWQTTEIKDKKEEQVAIFEFVDSKLTSWALGCLKKGTEKISLSDINSALGPNAEIKAD